MLPVRCRGSEPPPPPIRAPPPPPPRGRDTEPLPRFDSLPCRSLPLTAPSGAHPSYSDQRSAATGWLRYNSVLTDLLLVDKTPVDSGTAQFLMADVIPVLAKALLRCRIGLGSDSVTPECVIAAKIHRSLVQLLYIKCLVEWPPGSASAGMAASSSQPSQGGGSAHPRLIQLLHEDSATRLQVLLEALTATFLAAAHQTLSKEANNHHHSLLWGRCATELGLTPALRVNIAEKFDDAWTTKVQASASYTHPSQLCKLVHTTSFPPPSCTHTHTHHLSRPLDRPRHRQLCRGKEASQMTRLIPYRSYRARTGTS